MSVVFARDGQLFTPPLSAGILAGITRRFLIDRVAPRAGVTVQEATLRPEDLPSMQEAFFLSTTKDLTPIAAIDAQTFATGPATLTYRLKAIFAEVAHDYCAACAGPHRF
jgi:branched-chain amino acid aminotransferase